MQKYYYKDHHLYQYYCCLGDQLFKTRDDYLNYCDKEGLELKETLIKRKSKYALEWELIPPSKRIKTTLAKKTLVFDSRDISHYYFEDETDANNFLAIYKEGDPSFAIEALFQGYEGEPDYSPEAITNELLKDLLIEPFDSTKEFKRIAHYIISYLPDDPKIREARKYAHSKQIKSIKATTPHAKIFIIAQNYKEEDFINDPQITYYKYDKLGAMKARNTALKHFYNSDYDFCILNDDDTVVAPTDSAKNFFNLFEFSLETFDNVDIIWSRDMYHDPFQRNEVKKAEYWSNFYELSYAIAQLWHYAIIRNFKKYYNKEEYQDESVDPTTGMGYDDAEFCYQLHVSGYKIYKCRNAIQSYALNWLNLDGSIVYSQATNPWIRLNNRENSHKKWFYDPVGYWMDEEAFRKYCNRDNTHLEIPRTDNIDILSEFKGRNAPEVISEYLKTKLD